jgi:hypothetical protein
MTHLSGDLVLSLPTALSPAQDVVRLLESISHGEIGASLFVGTEPETPEECATVYDLAGLEVDTDEVDTHTAMLQVRVRSPQYSTAYGFSVAIRSTLLSTTQFLGESGRRYYGFDVTVDTAPLMRDDNDRYIFVTTYRAIYEESNS